MVQVVVVEPICLSIRQVHWYKLKLQKLTLVVRV
jgi:hypothetical protein